MMYVALDDTKRGALRAKSASKTSGTKKGFKSREMAKTIEARSYEEALAWLRDHGFDVTEAPGMSGRGFIRKYNVSDAIQKTPHDGVKILAYPGSLIGSEIPKMGNRGYQQFLKASKTEWPATAEYLNA